jgi:Fe-S-cluster-containing dehydrogenase component
MGKNAKHPKGAAVSGPECRARTCVVPNPSSCTGCGICIATCSLIKTGEIGIDAARLRVQRDPFAGFFEPVVCSQCSMPYCLKACKSGAITISAEDGSVLINETDCIGCRACQRACPYGVIVFNDESKKAYKCDLCFGSPACVDSCPSGALGLAIFKGRVW